MRKKKILPVLLFLSLISVGLIALSILQKLNFAENSVLAILTPFQRIILSAFEIKINEDSSLTELKKENQMLLKKLTDSSLLESENKALSDQFETSYPSSHNLLPAKVVGSPGFIPGVSEPSYLILDKGAKDGVNIGKAVVSEANLVGKVILTKANISKVQLITDKASSFTARSVSYDDGREAAGIVRGEGLSLVFGNILLSEVLKPGDIVLTKGDVTEEGSGFLPNLIVGTIVSVDKKSSDLFQKAKLESPIDFSQLSDVFIIIK